MAGHGNRPQDRGSIQPFRDLHLSEAPCRHFGKDGHLVPSGGPCLLDRLPEIGRVGPEGTGQKGVGHTLDRRGSTVHRPHKPSVPVSK
jgi:hypothetical protein